MNPTKRRSTSTVISYFVLALVFAGMAMLASRLPVLRGVLSEGTSAPIPNLQWIFWLFVILSFFSILPLIDSLLYQLHLRNRLPRMFRGLYSTAPASSKGSIVWSLKVSVKSLGGKLILASLAIFATVFLLSHLSTVRDKDLDSALYENISRMFGKHATLISNPIAVGLELLSDASSKEEIVKNYPRIIQDLKEAGAKAVLIGAPGSWDDIFRTTAAVLKRSDATDWFKKNGNTGIAVIGFPTGMNWRFADSAGKVRIPRAACTMSLYELREDRYLFRLKPEGYQHQFEKEPLDITLELLRKFRGYSKDLEPTRADGKVEFGDYRIPVTSDGWMFVRQPGFLRINWQQISVKHDDRTDSLSYHMFVFGGGMPAYSAVTSSDLKRSFDGKIVFLGQYDYTGPVSPQEANTAYITALQAIVNGTVVSKSETLHVWLTLICILVAGLAAFKLRPLPTMLTIFVLGFVTLLLCWLLYDRFYILIDVFYPLLATGMSMFVFPAVSLPEKIDAVLPDL